MAFYRIAAALLFAAASTPALASDCTMSQPDRAWLQQALAEWQTAETTVLKLDPATLPEVIAIDAACTYSLPAGDFAAMSGTPHGEAVKLPGGPELPLGPISFAMGGDAFVMSLPSVWRAAGVESEFGLERLMTGVLLHEIMHVRQTALANAALDPIAAAHGLEDSLSDDLLQETFQGDPAYVAAYEAERYKFFAAAEADSDADAVRLAAEGLALMRGRHARFFTGDKAYFEQLDNVFLTMEGMGQFLIYRYFSAFEDRATAIEGVRRGGKYWSQDEGLAIMLVVDRLLPNWQERALREPDWRAENLLAAALAQ